MVYLPYGETLEEYSHKLMTFVVYPLARGTHGLKQFQRPIVRFILAGAGTPVHNKKCSIVGLFPVYPLARGNHLRIAQLRGFRSLVLSRWRGEHF